MIERYGSRVDPRASVDRPQAVLALWTAVMGGPLAWLVFLQLDYALVHPACAWGRRWPLTAIAVAFSLAALATARLGWRIAHGRGEAARADTEVARERVRFMGQLGAAIGVFFAFIIAVSAIPTLLVSPCA